jgi:hypothetical protein
MKLWGDVDPAADANIQTTEGASRGSPTARRRPVTLSTGDGLKTLNVRIRDDVGNQSSGRRHDHARHHVPVITISVAASPTKISKVATFDTSTFQFQADVRDPGVEGQGRPGDRQPRERRHHDPDHGRLARTHRRRAGRHHQPVRDDQGRRPRDGVGGRRRRRSSRSSSRTPPATYAHTTGTNTSTLTATFTANGSDTLAVTLAKIGVLNASTVGTLGYETLLGSTATLTVSGDNAAITHTITAG